MMEIGLLTRLSHDERSERQAGGNSGMIYSRRVSHHGWATTAMQCHDHDPSASFTPLLDTHQTGRSFHLSHEKREVVGTPDAEQGGPWSLFRLLLRPESMAA